MLWEICCKSRCQPNYFSSYKALVNSRGLWPLLVKPQSLQHIVLIVYLMQFVKSNLLGNVEIVPFPDLFCPSLKKNSRMFCSFFICKVRHNQVSILLALRIVSVKKKMQCKHTGLEKILSWDLQSSCKTKFLRLAFHFMHKLVFSLKGGTSKITLSRLFLIFLHPQNLASQWLQQSFGQL